MERWLIEGYECVKLKDKESEEKTKKRKRHIPSVSVRGNMPAKVKCLRTESPAVAMVTAGGRHARRQVETEKASQQVRGRRRGVEGLRPTLFPLVCVRAALSACVEGVLLPLLAAEWVDALGMTMSKDGSAACCVKTKTCGLRDGWPRMAKSRATKGPGWPWTQC